MAGRSPHHHRVALPGPIDLDAFRKAARRLLAEGVPPAAVEWQVADQAEPDLFAADAVPAVDSEHDAAANPAKPPNDDGRGAAPRVPPAFLALCKSVILHRDPDRFGLLYRLLWRLQQETGLRDDPLDPDWIAAERMAKAVRRDQHKMTAFVRFRTVTAPEAGEPDLHVAWFEPEHHIVEATAGFFARRFANLHWAILTPERSVQWWPGAAGAPGRLELAPGSRREDAPPADAGEALWLTYYAHIFNPARLKLAMMQREMPRKYWHNLPEAQLIGELAAQATGRSARMIEQAPTEPARRIRPVAFPERPEAAELPGRLLRLADLKPATDRCRECPIGQHATQAVAGEGPAGARLMVVGEQPGDQEDLAGRPFVGPAGRLFDRAVAQLGWQRDRLYVTNAVKHFKFELRGRRRLHKTPGQREAEACRHWLEDEMRLVAPQAILALGATAARAVLGEAVAVTRVRGQWLQSPEGLPVLVTLHPSALLRADPQHGEENFRLWLQDLEKAAEYAAAG